MAVRMTGEDDWTELKHVRLRALADAPSAFAATLAEEQQLPEEEWRRRARPTESSANFLAIEDGEPGGLVAVFRDQERPLAHLVAMWVDPSHRGRGVGASLVASVIEWCVEQRVPEVRLWVVESNAAAERLYRSSGFLPTGGRQPLPSDPSLMELEMACPMAVDPAS